MEEQVHICLHLSCLPLFSGPGQSSILHCHSSQRKEVRFRSHIQQLPISGFNLQFPRAPLAQQKPSRCIYGRRGGRELTLRARRSFPAFFADTRERLSTYNTRPPIMAGAWQAAAVPCCKKRNIKSFAADLFGTYLGRRKGEETQVRTYIASGSIPSCRTHALEDVALIITRPSVVTRGFVTLTVTYPTGKKKPKDLFFLPQ